MVQLMAELKLFHCGLLFRGGHYVKGAYFLRKCYKQYESVHASLQHQPEIVQHDKDINSCLQLGLGLFYFFISLLPAKFHWIIQTFGKTRFFRPTLNRISTWSTKRPRYALHVLRKEGLSLAFGSSPLDLD
jgi:hypothetical protein